MIVSNLPESGPRSFSIREMTGDDIDGLMHLKKAEGWNQIEDDWRLILNYQDHVCLVATQKDEIIASVTAIIYSGELAWIGMMLVDRRFRGQGVGKSMMKAVVDLLRNCKSVKLDATDAGRPLYHKLDFRDELGICRLTCPSARPLSGKSIRITIKPMDPSSLTGIIAFDQRVFGTDRADLIRHLYLRSPLYAWFATKGSELLGFILGREGSEFVQAGPLYAVSEGVAWHLFEKLRAGARGKTLAADVPLDKANFIQWLMNSGFNRERCFTRMYLGENPIPGHMQHQYLIGGPELG